MLELDIGSECGGHGICGRDRVSALNTPHLSPPTEHEKEILGELLSQGIRLACQAYPEKDGDSLSFEIVS